MLCRCQSKAIEAHDAVIEESAAGSARVIPAVLKTNAGTSFPVGNPVFDRAGYCFHGLQKARPAAIAIPRDLRPDRRAPALVECPVYWQLGRHPQGARISSGGDFLFRDLVFEGNRRRVAFPFGDAVGKKTPELQVGI